MPMPKKNDSRPAKSPTSIPVASAVRTGALAFVLREFEPAPWPVSLVYPSHRLLPLKLRAFLDFAAPRLKARLARSEE